MSDKEFEIPRDENGKIDIAKLPEEIRDTIELIGELFTERNVESEKIIEQMIKVCQENIDGRLDDLFDFKAVYQRNMHLLGPDRNKAGMFDFSRPIRRQQILSALASSEKKHYGVLSTEEDLKKQGYKSTPNRSVGESEYIRPEDRDGLLLGFSVKEQMEMKLPDDLVAKLNPTPIFKERLAPMFDAVIARRHLFKGLLARLNEELQQGPFKDIIRVYGVTGNPHDNTVRLSPKFMYSIKPSFAFHNRYKAYSQYFHTLFDKYVKEIQDAETKVMERE